MKKSTVVVRNVGVAPIYYDAFAAINGTRSKRSLKGLGPGKSLNCSVNIGGLSPKLSIECDRLVKGQTIQFQADLK